MRFVSPVFPLSHVLWLLPVILLGCTARADGPQAYLARYGSPVPQAQEFRVCTGFGCRTSETTSLSTAEQESLQRLFVPLLDTDNYRSTVHTVPAIDSQGASANEAEGAEAERAAIASAVAYLERTVGQKVGTDRDLAKNRREGRTGQLDCVAETCNTTTYLLLMQRLGLLRLHEVAAPDSRGAFIFYPHNTAVIRERASGEFYAVDSWFHAAGEAPEIVPLEKWRAGYRPDNG